MKNLNDKKVVLHFLRTGEFSGAENVAITIIDEMNKRGFRCIYVSPSGSINNILLEHNIDHVDIASNSVREYQKVIRQYQPVVIHAHDFGTSLLVSMCKTRCLCISHLHNNPTWIKHVNYKTICYFLCTKKYHYILGVSQSVFDEYIFSRYIKSEKYVIGNPINCNKVRRLSKIASENIASDIIFLGRLTEQKDPIRFINIISLLSKKIQNLKVFMIGNGELKEDCESRILEKKMSNVIKLIGFKKNPYGYLNNSKILCVPSKFEGFGLVVVEAFSLGKPVVASPVGGMKTLVNDQCGKLCLSDEDFVEELYRLLNDYSYYTKKVNSAFLRGKELDNIELYMDNLTELYETCNQNNKYD